jgi:hypothetical protein
MSSLFGSAGGGPSDRPPAIYGPATAGPSASISTKWQQKISMLPLTLEPTTDPVWPEDEAQEEQSSRDAGLEYPPLAPDEEARQMAEKLRVELPDRLLGHTLKLPPNPWLATAGYDYYGLYVPTTFSAEPGIIPRRLRLQLKFYDANRDRPQGIPIACQLHPGTEVTTEITNIGEFKIDLGQAFTKTMWVFWPEMPEVLTARTGGSLDLKKVRARVQAAGLNTHRCEWRIADTEIAYTFNPACVLQVPKGVQLAVSARLHVEARKRIAVVFYRNYFRTTRPMHYVLRGVHGEPISSDNLSDGSEVILRQPDVLYSDEPTMFSQIEESSVKQINASTTDILSTDKVSRDAPSLLPEKFTAEPVSLIDGLSRLASLLDAGHLTKEEFDQLKAKIIAGS